MWFSLPFALFVLFLQQSARFSVHAQLDASLLNGHNYAPKPTVPPELAKYFELDGHARELIDTLIAPRPGGFFPEKTYEISAPKAPPGPTEAPDQLQQIGKAVEQFLSGPPQTNEYQLPPGFNQGFSIGGTGGGKNMLAFQQSANPVHVDGEHSEAKTVGADGELRRKEPSPPPISKSSIAGIPNDFPKLPKFPISALPAEIRRQQPMVMRQSPEIPKFASKPEVPEGGLGPAGESERPNSVSETSDALASNAADASEYGGLSDESPAPGGLIGTVLDLFGMNKEGKSPTDAGGIGRAVGNLLGGSNSPLPGKQFINNVLYKTLTSGSVQPSPSASFNSSSGSDPFNSTSAIGLPIPPSVSLPPVLAALFPDLNTSTPITLTAAQQDAIGENLEMIQNLIVQPSSPLCNPKPVPVTEFNLDAFMGQWYQVMYSPPLAQSACSLVSYRKLADINNGGIGSIFEVFEHTTDGTPYSKPKITSGYAIIKQMGELIFRTTAHQEDVNIHVLFNGPSNERGQYEFTVVSTNCNYPVYVFARDPISYKQKYETAVQQILEQKGVVNGISKMFNIISPVDATTCTFPTNLFNNNDGRG
uniref:Lipocalin domain-containing protein n=1 Tax=Globodera pallida TaxID=36090 RepID=A0A183C972_GLOPA